VYEVGEKNEQAAVSSLLAAVGDAVRALRQALRPPSLGSFRAAASGSRSRSASPSSLETIAAETALVAAAPSLRLDRHNQSGAAELFSSSPTQLWGRCEETSDYLEITSGPGVISSLVHSQLVPLKGESVSVCHAVDRRGLGLRRGGWSAWSGR
jgi:hypothetical protein